MPPDASRRAPQEISGTRIPATTSSNCLVPFCFH
jgi:hypothetical protein